MWREVIRNKSRTKACSRLWRALNGRLRRRGWSRRTMLSGSVPCVDWSNPENSEWKQVVIPLRNAEPQVQRAGCPMPLYKKLEQSSLISAGVLGPIPHGYRAPSSCLPSGEVKAHEAEEVWVAKDWCTCFWAECTKSFSRTENTSTRVPVFSYD